MIRCLISMLLIINSLRIHHSHSIIYEKSLSYYFAEEYKSCDQVSAVMADMIEKGKGISSEMFLSELESQTTKIQNINHQIKDYDAILTISTASSAPLRNEVEKNDPSLAFTYLGMPSLHVPNSKASSKLTNEGKLNVLEKSSLLL